MDYKKTLNLPQTAFSMKADLPKKEPLILQEWQKKDLYDLMRKKAKGAKKYILHDGPPYANGNIHIGHALNKILKDIIVKYKTMQGFDSPYVPGWDCHGLPVEHQLFRELGIDKYQIDKVKFRKKAHKFAMKFVDIQKEEFIRLGVFGSWKDPYLTLNPSYEGAILDSFKKLVKNGYVYKGLKPINWCIKCETALAEAEVEYENHTSPSVYVKFKVKDTKKLSSLGVNSSSNAYFLIWTTTPWTLVANVAVAIHPDLQYAVLSSDKETVIVAEELATSIMEKNDTHYEVKAKIKGNKLENILCQHPFLDRESRVVLANYVSNQEGTGCVHTAPGHGAEDYHTGLRYKLEVVMPVSPKGIFDDSAGELSGAHVFKANAKIIEILQKNGLLFHKGSITHSYPHCWRCKEPVITRATKQWFINVDHNDLRKKTLKIIKDVKWIPAIGESRISSMVENRPDWCLSRQRYWGVPIPAFYCKACGCELLDADAIESVRKIVTKEGSDAWFIKEAKELLPKGLKCKKCKAQDFVKEEDILDVWFDSGASHQAVLEQKKDLSFPCDLYLEGSDQHRGWFQTSLLTSVGIANKAPFRSVLTHGFVVDGDGRKMSKSLGNVIAPQQIMAKYGADILRLWIASSNYSDDIRISNEILARISESYRKIRNTMKFILGNLYDFDAEKDLIKLSSRLQIDRWAISKTHTVIKKVTDLYERFEFYKIYRVLYDFCITELSSFYFDILKDRLYTFGKDSKDRKSAQSSLYEILLVLEKLIAPILVFTAEDAWKNTTLKKKEESVHLSSWPKAEDKFIDLELEERWQQIIKVREFLLKAIEKKRMTGGIGSSLEARIELAVKDNKLYSLLDGHRDELPAIFIVSEAELSKADNINEDFLKDEKLEGVGVLVQKASGEKCSRCWNYSVSVGEDQTHPNLCQRCRNVVTK